MTFTLEQLIYLIPPLLSHIVASLFFAKPRFGKTTTTIIWLTYAVVFLLLPPDTPTINYFISFAVHLILFFVTTVGAVQEKGFLFLTYSCFTTCFGTISTNINIRLQSIPIKIVVAFIMITLMQVILYGVLLPSFRKVTPYIHSGWVRFYAVVLIFFALLVAQSVFPILSPMTSKEMVVFLLTIFAFCITYTAVFGSMKSMVALAREKQKQTHAELLLSQVQAQAKEAEAVRQNRHDMHHHYQMLLSYAENGEIDNLISYLKRQTERIETITTGRFCENEIVNNILKFYHQKATEQNITIKIRAAAKPTLSAAPPDLVAIIANILENALHGVAESNNAEPFIQVNIKHQARHFVVTCDNSCNSSLDFAEMPDWLRGIGINSITTTTDKYGGSCLFSAKDGVFHCMVIMDE